MRVIIYLFLFVGLCGCTETRSEKQASIEKRDTYTVSGSAAVPLPQGGTAAVPVSLTVERVGSERLTEHSEEKTQIDGTAIAQQVGAVVGKSLDAVVAKLTGLQPQAVSRPGGLLDSSEGIIGLLGGTGGAGGIAYAVAQMLSRRNERKELEQVKADRDEGWDHALKMAKLVPPESLTKPT